MTKAVRNCVGFVVCLALFAAGLMAMKLAPAARAWRSGEFPGIQGTVIRLANHAAAPRLAQAGERRRLPDIAPFARVTVSSFSGNDPASDAGAVDAREWMSGPQPEGSWIMLDWKEPTVVHEIDLYDRTSPEDNVRGGLLTFSDGSVIGVGPLPVDGSPARIGFRPKSVKWVSFRIGATQGSNPGLADIIVRGELNPWGRPGTATN
jgi:hypothetical protein